MALVALRDIAAGEFLTVEPSDDDDDDEDDDEEDDDEEDAEVRRDLCVETRPSPRVRALRRREPSRGSRSSGSRSSVEIGVSHAG